MNLEIDYLWSHKCPKKWDQYTLIALVITIIVLLILAGVTVMTLTGDNGLLQKASEAKSENEKSAVREEIDLILLQAKMENYLKDNNLKNLFKEATIIPDPEVDKTASIYEVTYKGMDFLVSNNLDFIEKIEANINEWEFNETTGALTAYNGDLTTKRRNQEIGELIIPNYYNGKRVKKAGSWNFLRGNNDKLFKLTISEGIEEIGAESFASSVNLESLKIPNSLTYIGRVSFYNCTSLTGDLIIPDNVISIGGEAFERCSSLNGNLKLGKNLEKIEGAAFSRMW